MPAPMAEWMAADWPAPVSVRAGTTTRQGGTSTGAFSSLNLATHVGDRIGDVSENRARVYSLLELPSEPLWLNQVHGTHVARAEHFAPAGEADAIIATQSGTVCAILTADCLPVLFCDDGGSRIAAAHAGWRGLAAGILEHTVSALGCAPASLLVWLGPAIGPEVYEVGPEVRARFIEVDPSAVRAFRPTDGGRYLADLYALARGRLLRLGVERVYGGSVCTFSDPARFFSYRRDGACGRMASLVWRVPD
ncbi:MAG: peptidoglycan editing factor PgeF [Acidiferrobacteraceae bacterium]